MIGRTVLHYELLEELSAVSAGGLFLALDVRSDRVVVLCFLPPGLLPSELLDRQIGTARGEAVDVERTAEGNAFLVLRAAPEDALVRAFRDGPASALAAVELTLALGEAYPEDRSAWALGALLSELLNRTPRGKAAPALTELLQRTLADPSRESGPTREELLAELRRWRSVSSMVPVTSLAAPWWTRAGVVLPVLALIALGLAYSTHKSTRLTRARNRHLPEIEELSRELLFDTAGNEAWRAYDLALEARAALGDDPRLERAWRTITSRRSFHSEPDGVEVFATAFSEPNGPWRRIGTTPIEEAAFPRGVSLVRLRKKGFEPLVDLVLNVRDQQGLPPYRLPRAGTALDGMVPARGESGEIFLPGFDDLEPLAIGDFWIGRCEVTNAEFKRFRNQDGGYRERKYWKHPFVEMHEGRELSFDEAMERFVDSTGKRGPSTWANGLPPDGEMDHPVTGVSWYEAAAYAESLGMRLPTLFHWNQVSAPRASSGIVPHSNLEGEGLAAVGSFPATHRFGTKDLAGNAREWCRNQVDPGGLRLVLGGAWSESAYAFLDPNALDPFDRSPVNGFRCVLPVDEEAPELERNVLLPTRDFLSEEPADDETFEVYLEQFDSPPTPLNAEVLYTGEWGEKGTYQRIEFDTAYDGERMAAFLFLPVEGTPPYQTVVAFPGSELMGIDLEDPFERGARKFYYEFLVRSGRAVVFPVYKGLLDRPSGLERSVPQPTAQYRDHVIMWAKDLTRTIDYVATRADLDSERLAYFGFNWGASMGAMMPAIETRFDASILYVAGLRQVKPLPEVDAIHYVSRVTTPTLMINGEYDYLYPVETSQRPMFELLGCLPENKKWVTFEGSHAVPRVEFVKESLAWLDRYLGPVTL